MLSDVNNVDKMLCCLFFPKLVRASWRFGALATHPLLPRFFVLVREGVEGSLSPEKIVAHFPAYLGFTHLSEGQSFFSGSGGRVVVSRPRGSGTAGRRFPTLRHPRRVAAGSDSRGTPYLDPNGGAVGGRLGAKKNTANRALLVARAALPALARHTLWWAYPQEHPWGCA
jgi:hypothetical protein